MSQRGAFWTVAEAEKGRSQWEVPHLVTHAQQMTLALWLSKAHIAIY